jgi:cytochrome d ubiquinol oxidase subunit II
LDWYTVLGGILALAALSLHGALYLALKTEGQLEQRAVCVARRAWLGTVILSAMGIPATVLARPASLHNYDEHPIAFLAPLVAVAAIAIMRWTMKRGLHFSSFMSSCGFLSAMILGAATGLFPVLLPAVGTQGRDITILQAVSGPHTLRVGLAWWSAGICLALMYFTIVYWNFRGKVPTDAEGYGH